MPPPKVVPGAEFPVMVEFVTLRVPIGTFSMPPPATVAELPAMVENVTDRFPALEMPPPVGLEFPVMVDRVTVRSPAFMMPPPVEPDCPPLIVRSAKVDVPDAMSKTRVMPAPFTVRAEAL